MDIGRTPWWRVRVSRTRQAIGLLLLVLVSVFFYAMGTQGLRFFVVDSGSMEPTVWPGDRLVAIREAEYRRGDIVIVRDPSEKKGYLVKRLVGLPGDTIEVHGGAVFLNGQYLSEPYRPEAIEYSFSPYVVPEDSIFVLGDNSNKSLDSHNWAGVRVSDGMPLPKALPAESLIARAIYQYYPLTRMGRMRHYPVDELIAPPARTAESRRLQ